MDQQVQLRDLEAKEGIVNLDCELAGPKPMVRVAVVVLSTAIVQEGKGLDDSRVRASAFGKPEAVVSNSGPVRRTVNATPVESEVCFEKPKEMGAIHGA